MLNFNNGNVQAYPDKDSLGTGIIRGVDLEQLIRESERLRVCEAVFQSKMENWHKRDTLEVILGMPRALVLSYDTEHKNDEDSPLEDDHA